VARERDRGDGDDQRLSAVCGVGQGGCGGYHAPRSPHPPCAPPPLRPSRIILPKRFIAVLSDTGFYYVAVPAETA